MLEKASLRRLLRNSKLLLHIVVAVSVKRNMSRFQKRKIEFRNTVCGEAFFVGTKVWRVLQLRVSCCIITCVYVGIPRKDDGLVSAGRNVVDRNPGGSCGKDCARSCHGVMS
jgi:hypothetical protein